MHCPSRGVNFFLTSCGFSECDATSGLLHASMMHPSNRWVASANMTVLILDGLVDRRVGRFHHAEIYEAYTVSTTMGMV